MGLAIVMSEGDYFRGSDPQRPLDKIRAGNMHATTSLRHSLPISRLSKLVAAMALVCGLHGVDAATRFNVEETTISDIHQAILSKQLTCSELVNLYLERIKAFNGPGVLEPEGI